MTISRLLILQAVLACGLGVILFIPSETKIQPCRVRMELPETLGTWTGKPAEVTKRELEGLAPDTKFCRKLYDDGFGDQVLVSIVLSGADLDNSIHRPERCLPSQGWSVESSGRLALPVAAATGGQLPVTRLRDMRQEKLNGHVVNIYNLNYYWFIGYTDITASHFRREYIDMKDRLLHGYNQRWAYVTVAATITKNLAPFGRDEPQTDRMIQKIITDVYPQIITDPNAAPDPVTVAKQ
jgi:EpsI family protein